MSGLLLLAGAGFAAAAYFNVDKGGLRFGSCLVAMLVCFGFGILGTPKSSTAFDCRNYSQFASDC